MSGHVSFLGIFCGEFLLATGKLAVQPLRGIVSLQVGLQVMGLDETWMQITMITKIYQKKNCPLINFNCLCYFLLRFMVMNDIYWLWVYEGYKALHGIRSVYLPFPHTLQ